MKTTYKKIVEIHDLYRKLLEMPMRAGTARDFVKHFSELTNCYEKIAEKQSEIFEKYGSTKEDGTFHIETDRKEKAGKEFEVFLEQEIDLEGFPISVIDDELQLTPMDIIRLKEFIAFMPPC